LTGSPKFRSAIKIREGNIESAANDIRDVAGKVIEILESEILANTAVVKFDFEVETIVFPKIYLESILLNLVANAVKYRQPSIAPEILLKTYTGENGRTVLECTDNGVGINLDLYGTKIFGLYKTFHNNKDAHGVGLFLVKTQVESQGGLISVESIPGKGSTFKIIFA